MTLISVTQAHSSYLIVLRCIGKSSRVNLRKKEGREGGRRKEERRKKGRDGGKERKEQRLLRVWRNRDPCVLLVRL